MLDQAAFMYNFCLTLTLCMLGKFQKLLKRCSGKSPKFKQGLILCYAMLAIMEMDTLWGALAVTPGVP